MPLDCPWTRHLPHLIEDNSVRPQEKQEGPAILAWPYLQLVALRTAGCFPFTSVQRYRNLSNMNCFADDTLCSRTSANGRSVSILRRNPLEIDRNQIYHVTKCNKNCNFSLGECNRKEHTINSPGRSKHGHRIQKSFTELVTTSFVSSTVNESYLPTDCCVLNLLCSI